MMQLQKIDSQGVIAPNADAVAHLTAQILVKSFSRILRRKRTVLFIPSSGNTPLKTYELLATQYKNAIDWSRITLIQMDEYAAGNLDVDLYFKSFLQKFLVAPLGIGDFISMHKDDGQSLHHPQDYARKLVALGPVDFALHGIGRNGHIGFNEPGSSASSHTRIVNLATATLDDNFPQMATINRPQHGMTLGLKELRNVRHTILIATGKHKSMAIQKLLKKSCTLETPASALWGSADFGLIIDKDAASMNPMHSAVDFAP